MSSRAVTTAIGLPQQGTIKVSQMDTARARAKALKAAGAASMADGRRDRAARAGKAAGKASKRMWKAKALRAEGDGPCPMRSVLEAATAGDKDAVTRAVNLYGPGWRAMARRLLRQE